MSIKAEKIGSKRSSNLILQIGLGIVLKGLLFIISYFQITLFAKILNKDQIGIWLTYLSFYNWFILFDFGVGHGLKNILSEKLAEKNTDSIKKIATNGILISVFISILLIAIFLVADQFINYSSVFKTEIEAEVLKTSLWFTFFACIILFVNNAINAIMNASQKTSYTNFLNLFVNLFIVVAIYMYIYGKCNIDPLYYLSKVNMYFYVIFFVVITGVFLYRNPIFMPSVHLFDVSNAKEILLKGMQFFLIQITILIIFPIDSFLISNMISSSEAGRYNVIVKLFSYSIVFVSIITQSSWPAFTEAFYKRDYEWIQKTFHKINKFSFLIFLTLLPVAFLAQFIILKWTNVDYEFTSREIIIFLVLHFFYIFCFNFATLLLAINKLKSQMYLGVSLGIIKCLGIFMLEFFKITSLESMTIVSTTVFGIYFLVDYILIKSQIKSLK